MVPNTDTSKKRQFKPDFRNGYLSALGFLGLICGFVLMAHNDVVRWPWEWGKPMSNFHEIDYHPGELADQGFRFLSGSLDQKISQKRQALLVLQRVKKGETLSPARSDSIKSLSLDIAADSSNKVIIDRLDKTARQSSSSDSTAFTSLNRMLHFNITPETMRQWAIKFDSLKYGYEWTDTTSYWLRVTETKPELSYSGVARFKIYHPDTDMQFAMKYPAVGTWVFVITIFCAFCFIAVSTGYMIKQQLLKYFKEQEIGGPSARAFYLLWIMVLAAMGLLWVIWRHTFNDELPIQPIYFMKYFQWSMLGVNLIGYLAGSCCLAGFIYCAAMLGFFVKSICQQTKDISQKRSVTPIKRNLADASTPEQKELEKMQKDRKDELDVYKRLLGYFNKYFALSAVILSLLVLCAGSLFNTFNSLDFVRLLADDWGYSPGRTDIVYLYGGFYTVILLLVYLPARIRFSEIQLEIPQPANATDLQTVSAGTSGGSKTLDIVKGSFGQFKDVLIAASPLLTGILQGLLDALFK